MTCMELTFSFIGSGDIILFYFLKFWTKITIQCECNTNTKSNMLFESMKNEVFHVLLEI